MIHRAGLNGALFDTPIRRQSRPGKVDNTLARMIRVHHLLARSMPKYGPNVPIATQDANNLHEVFTPSVSVQDQVGCGTYNRANIGQQIIPRRPISGDDVNSFVIRSHSAIIRSAADGTCLVVRHLIFRRSRSDSGTKIRCVIELMI